MLHHILKTRVIPSRLGAVKAASVKSAEITSVRWYNKEETKKAHHKNRLPVPPNTQAVQVQVGGGEEAGERPVYPEKSSRPVE